MTKPLPFTAFARDVLRLRLTRGQRVLARVAFDDVDPCDLEGDERELARQIFGDVETVPPHARQLVALELGRNSGKTTIVAAYQVYSAVTADLSTRGPGDVPVAVYIGPRKETAAVSIRVARELVRHARAGSLERLVESEAVDGFTLRRPDGRLVAVEAFAASSGGASVRSRSILSFVLDEAQFFRSDSASAVTDRDSYQAMSPRLMGKGIFISTPWPTPTLMAELMAKNFEAPTIALAARAPTMLMRDGDPTVAATIARERAIDADNAAREFDCDMSAIGAENFFDGRAIAAAVVLDRAMTITAAARSRVALGADIGLIRDSSTIAAIARLEDRYSLLELQELRPSKGEPLKLSHVVATFAEVTRRHGQRSFIADGHVREPAREFAQAEKISIDAAPEGREGKERTYLAVRKLFTEGRIQIPNHPRLIAQLGSVVSKAAAGGGLSFSIPRRVGTAHGDLVSAFVLAAHHLEATGPARTYVPRARGSYRFAGGGRGY